MRHLVTNTSIKQSVISLLTSTLLLFTLSIFSNCTMSDPSGPREWSLKGKLSFEKESKIDLQSKKIKIGIFPHNAESFSPKVENLEASGGTAVVDTDSSFKLNIDTRNIHTNYIHTLVWFDSDDDNKLDIKSEPYTTVLEQNQFHGTALFYLFDEREDSWLSPFDKSQSKDLSDLNLILNIDLVGSRTSWSLSGKLNTDTSYSLDLSSQKIQLGVFTHSSETFQPSSQITIPNAGNTTVATDGSFSLNINVVDGNNGNLSILAWYDENLDGKLDPSNEMYTKVFCDKITNSASQAYHFSKDKDLWLASFDNHISQNEKSLIFTTKQGLNSVDTAWHLKGKIKPALGKSLRLNTNQLKIGGFSLSSSDFGDPVVQLQPKFGYSTVLSDSSFDLSIKTNYKQDKSITPMIWLDLNDNNILDSLAEPYSTLQIPSGTLKNNSLKYKFDTTKLIWIVDGSTTLATKLLSQTYSIPKNVMDHRYQWNIKSILVADPGYEIDYSSNKIIIGAFATTTSPITFEQDNAIPQCGSSSLKSNKQFDITINVQNISQTYCNLIAWYDMDGDGRLDATTEAYQTIRSSVNNKVPFNINYSATSQEWFVGTSPVQSISYDSMIVNRNISQPLTSWNLSGKIQPISTKKFNLIGANIKIGAFASDKSSFSSITDGITPLSSSVVSSDSSFSLKVNTSTKKYIHIIAWYDTNGNQLLDPSKESYSTLIEESYFGGNSVYYSYNTTLLEWQNTFDSKPVRGLSSVKFLPQSDLDVK